MMDGRTRLPFTATQWQELEQQALIFKHMASGVPIPPDLLLTVERSLEYSLSSRLMHHHYQAEWNCFQMGFGKKIDPEPGRCRRTDGKKWRCSKEAYPDSKYCERHIHRGRNRLRKPAAAAAATTNPSVSVALLPHSSSWRTPGFELSPYDKGTTHSLLDSSIGLKQESDYRYNNVDEPMKLKPLTMSSDFDKSGYPFIEPHGSSDISKQVQHFGDRGDDRSNKVMHQFLDPWPSNGGDSWADDDKKEVAGYGPVSTTQLSISMPLVCHDFLMTHDGS